MIPFLIGVWAFLGLVFYTVVGGNISSNKKECIAALVCGPAIWCVFIGGMFCISLIMFAEWLKK